MNLREVEQAESLVYKLTRAFSVLGVTPEMGARLTNLDNIIAEVRHFAEAYDEARRLTDADHANRIRFEADARWTAFITGGQGS